MNEKQRKVLYRIVAAVVALVFLQFAELGGAGKLAGYLAVYLLIGYDILYRAGKGIIRRQVFDENFLMAVATVGAFALAIYEASGDYLEGIAVMLFYQIGELFQSYAVGKSRRDICELMNLRPDYANIEIDCKLQQADPEEIAIGTEIVVQPGEKVPLDGVVISGVSTVDTSALTGESVPVDVKENQTVASGCINLTGVLHIRTTKEFGDSTVAKIMELVENASSQKSKSEEFIAKFARVYTPFVCYSALALAVLPPLVNYAIGNVPGWNTWFYRALIFLVISCPCALVISIPLSFFAGLGGASRAGVIIKGSNYLETLAKVKYVVFDKTGTLTHGNFEVEAVHHNEMPEEQFLNYAALAECASSHPISKSLQRACDAKGVQLDRQRVSNIEEISGHGITATVDGRAVAIGNSRLMDKMDIPFKECHSLGTIVHVALDKLYAGHIVIADKIKAQAKAAIAELKALGMKEIVMLTGDMQPVAAGVAEEIGIEKVYSQLLPGDKVAKVEEMLNSKGTDEKLAFVGDGINDAPVLTRADVGIAMGGIGSDAAIEAADVVLMEDNPLQVAKAIRIAKKCLGIVYQNIVFSLVIKFSCLALGAVGIANMWFAIFADVGVMVLAVLNAIRALQVENV
ncbi:MAG: heavy metal translocating P-type ATPase [Selenomonadaceae bacterium]|nr:heavy metal translocating P-type ATPase [Selenomonadaceae bacterium]